MGQPLHNALCSPQLILATTPLLVRWVSQGGDTTGLVQSHTKREKQNLASNKVTQTSTAGPPPPNILIQAKLSPFSGTQFLHLSNTVLINESKGPILLLSVSLKILPVSQVW